MANCECGGKHQHQLCIGKCDKCGQCGYKHHATCPLLDTAKAAEDMWRDPDDDDRDPSNVQLRAGYLAGMAAKLPPGDDRTFLLRSSRSLRAYAAFLLKN
jgi:hypothetical protein